MTDMIRKHIYAQKAKLVRGSCSAQVQMETACKEEAYDDVLAYIDKLEKKGPTARERYDVILDAAQRAVGVKLTEERTQENTDIRMLVVKQMRSERYSTSVIGMLLQRDHSTISYLNKCMNEMLSMPGAFSRFMHKYYRFKDLLGQ